KFQQLLERNPGFEGAWEVQKQIGEILFVRTQQYEAAIQHYRELLRQHPDADEAPEFLLRIGRSHFFLHQFPQAVAAYEELQKHHPESAVAEEAAYQVGVTWYTQGEEPGSSGGAVFKRAIKAFESFQGKYPRSARAVEAKF